jgi:hypothetical protein
MFRFLDGLGFAAPPVYSFAAGHSKPSTLLERPAAALPEVEGLAAGN